MRSLLHLNPFLALMLLLTACKPGAVVDQPVTTEAGTSTRLAEINTQLGVEYMKAGNNETALKKLQKALNADSSYPRVYDVLGLLYARLGENGKAEQNFKRALHLAPNDASILNNYGQFLCRQGDPTRAQQLFAKAVQNPLYQTPDIAYTNAAICALERQKDKTSAETYLREALSKNPEMPVALLQMARLSFEQQKHLAARGYLERYGQVANHTSQSLWLGVQIERKLGNEDAASSYGMALKGKYPDAEETREFMKTEQ
ncbi:MAG: type IV pilus biogenesis/stability protein PilW [Chromatiales bacterium]